MKIERRPRTGGIAGIACIAVAGLLAACNTVNTLVEERAGGEQAGTPMTRAITGLADLPFASAYVRSGDRFEGLLILGSIDAGGAQTWYGRDGLVLQLDGDRVTYSRGLPVDVLETYPADVGGVEPTQDCGDGVSHTEPPSLFYTRLRGAVDYLAEQRIDLRCRIEALVTPAYGGAAIRIDETYRVLPYRHTQRRSLWLHPQTRQLLRLEYGPHPAAPELSIVWIKPPARR
ncbi:hypothetical protein AAG565_03210 [Fontimonas sp. SYSU GA230001]|uniref:hypothetical protein n=1 Tax=Fontimonas sp. SYSU GA230001 TaxID=3142450 RepID=UPI0032B58FA6